MGACISSALADLVLDEILDLTVVKLPFQLPFSKKYVDDLITVVPQDSVQVVHVQ